VQRHLAQIKCHNPVEDLPWAFFPHSPLLQALPPQERPPPLLLLVVLAVLLPADLPVLAVFLLQAVFPVLPPLL
jgi:hypothetical protein